MTMIRTLLLQLRFIITLGLLAVVSVSPLAAHPRIQGAPETISIRVSEGIALGFDISPEDVGSFIDLLGQL